jgi:hypothetical protein
MTRPATQTASPAHRFLVRLRGLVLAVIDKPRLLSHSVSDTERYFAREENVIAPALVNSPVLLFAAINLLLRAMLITSRRSTELYTTNGDQSRQRTAPPGVTSRRLGAQKCINAACDYGFLGPRRPSRPWQFWGLHTRSAEVGPIPAAPRRERRGVPAGGVVL